MLLLLLLLLLLSEDRPVPFGDNEYVVDHIWIDDPLLTEIMIEWTNITNWTLNALLTAQCTVPKRMVIIFFPAMTFHTIVPIFTSDLVTGKKTLMFPFLAFHRLILTIVEFPPEILPVMCINTLRSIMFE